MTIKKLFAMRRANGDWFALDDHGSFRVPIFHSSGEAMIARARESTMECFRPIELDSMALTNLTTTDEGKACFWLIADPLLSMSRGRTLDHNELKRFMIEAPAVQRGGRQVQ